MNATAAPARPRTALQARQECLLARYRDAGLPKAERDAALAELVASMRGLILSLARRYASHDRGRRRQHLSDLIQEGYLGVLDGIERADPGRGAVSAICYIRINYYMMEYNLSMRSHLYIPREMGRDVARYARFRRSGRVGEDGSMAAFAASRHMTPEAAENLRKAIAAVYAVTFPVNPTIDAAGDEGAWGNIDGPGMTRDRVEALLATLPGRYAAVLRMVYLDRRTLASVGRELGVSKERVRQIKDKGLNMLRRRNGIRPGDDWSGSLAIR